MENDKTPNEEEIARHLEEMEKQLDEVTKRAEAAEQKYDDARSMPRTLRQPKGFVDQDTHRPGLG